MDQNLLYGIGLMALPLLLSLTLHEYGHARVAQAFGDYTAKMLGRCTLNPLAHLDLVGTLCFFFGPIGWAKPVPVDPSRLHPARIGDIAVSLAGVGMNLLLAIGCLIGLYIMAALGVKVNDSPESDPTPAGVLAFMLSLGLLINLSLLLFNIIPLYPLDGHHVVRELLPWPHRASFMDWQGRVGRYVLLGLVALPWLLGFIGARGRFDPIGAYFDHVLQPIVSFTVTGKAADLFLSAFGRYGMYLTWR